jgi:hypothetical protein
VIPLALRELPVGKVRVCKRFPETKIWYAEKRAPIYSNDQWALSTFTTEIFMNHSDALACALAWLPPKEATK